MLEAGGAVELELVPEGQAELGPAQIRQITGATITSKAVTDMLGSELSRVAGSLREESK